ncbi:MAG: type IV pilin-like G/H family protein [Cyanobacteria bacterium J06629_18]
MNYLWFQIILIFLAAVTGCRSYSDTKSTELWMGECDLEYFANLNYQINRKAEFTPISYVSFSHKQSKLFIGKQNIAKKESVGKSDILTMNRAQQAYFIENNEFAKNLRYLELGIESETEYYSYKIILQNDFSQSVKHIAQSKKEYLKNYIGLVFVTIINGHKTTVSKYCETSKSINI